MKLADELRQIERAKTSDAWPSTIEQLAEFMKERAHGNYYAAISVSVHTAQVELLLKEWATDQGFVITNSTGSFTPTLWIAWGNKPNIASKVDAEIFADGTISINKT